MQTNFLRGDIKMAFGVRPYTLKKDRKKDEEIDLYACPVCGYITDNKGDYKKHVKDHVPE